MKKIVNSFMLLAAAAMAFSSCSDMEVSLEQAEVSAQTTVFHITANAPATRTVFGAKTSGSYPTLWTENKDVCFSANGAATVFASPVIEDDGVSASFEPVFSSPAASGTIYAFSPKGVYDSSKPENNVPGFTSINSTYKDIYLNIPSAQTPLAGSVDESAQAIAASASYSEGNTSVAMSFEHIVAYGKMTITGFAGTIKSVELQFPEKVAGTSCMYYYETGSLTVDSKGTNSIVLDPANVSGGVFWFALAPTANVGKMSIIITDSADDTYTKELTLTADQLPFVAGQVSAFSVSFSGIEKEADCVTLPWEWEGGTKSGFSAIIGVSESGLGDDYAATHSPYRIKLDNSNDYFIIKTDSAIGIVTIGVKMIGGGSTSTISIFGSVDGNSYSKVQDLTISGASGNILTLATTEDFDPDYRYVKAVFTKGSNVGVGPISITKPDTTPAIMANDISGVAAAGVIDAEETYKVKNFTDDVEVASVTGCVSEAIADGGELVYTVAPNYTGAAANGTIVLCSAADPSVTMTISVSQLADKFTVSETSVLLGNPVSSSKTFKVSSTYAATITNPDEDKLSISPTEIEAGSENVVVTVTALTQNMDEEDVDEIGDIVITRSTGVADENKTKSVAVTQAVKPTAGAAAYVKVSAITIGKKYLLVVNTYDLIFDGGGVAKTTPGHDATIQDDMISSTPAIDTYAVTIESGTVSETYKVKLSTNKYLVINASSTSNGDLTSDDSGENIKINSVSGGFQFVSSNRSTRGLAYRVDASGFKNYATSNFSAVGYSGTFTLYEYNN